MSHLLRAAVAAGLLAGLSACATTKGEEPAAAPAAAKPLPRGLEASGEAFASTYQPMPSRPTALVGGTAPLVGQVVETATGHDLAPAAYVAGVAVVALAALRSWPETAFGKLS